MPRDAVFVLFFFVGMPWVVASIVRAALSHQRYMKVLQLKAEANARLMDRFGQDPALLDFLKSDAQRGLFDVKLSEDRSRMPAPYSRMLTSVQVSVLLLSAGVACLFIRQYVPENFHGDRLGWLFFGTMGVALGIGSLLAGAAAFAAARMWHAMKDENA